MSVLAMAGSSNSQIADALGRLAQEIDLALWALVGRSPSQALHRLNLGRTTSAPVLRSFLRPQSQTLDGFIRETFR